MKSLWIDLVNHKNRKADINLRRTISDWTSSSKSEFSLCSCLLCNQSSKKFCNSHSIPRECLKYISINGEVFNYNKLINIPEFNKTNGLNKTGTFKVICTDCDSNVFREYEDFENYSTNISTTLLNKIALKNYLLLYSKVSINYLIMEKLGDSLHFLNPYKETISESNRIRNIDRKRYFQEMINCKKLLDNNAPNYYRVILNTKLNYTTAISVQTCISLYVDLDFNLINNVFDSSKKNKIEDLHICIFPYKEETFITIFCKNQYKKYSQFSKTLNKLTPESQLKLINYIIFLYSEEVYISPLVDDSILENKNLKNIVGHSTIGENGNTEILLTQFVENYSLKNFDSIPNFLSKELSIQAWKSKKTIFALPTSTS